MSRMSLLSSPMLLGFEEIERLIDRVGKGASDGYPPYNIERIAKDGERGELLRITLAVAGFTRDQLEITVEDNQLTIRGKQQEDKSRGVPLQGHRRPAVPTHFCPRRRYRDQERGSEQRSSVHRSHQARAGAAGATN